MTVALVQFETTEGIRVITIEVTTDYQAITISDDIEDMRAPSERERWLAQQLINEVTQNGSDN